MKPAFRYLAWVAALACLAWLPLPAGAAQATDPYPPDIKAVKDRGKLVVAQANDEAPGYFQFDDKNEFPHLPGHAHQGRRLVGYDIIVARAMAAHLGLPLELDRQAEDYNEVCLRVARGQADLGISCLSITPRRAQFVLFSKPYAMGSSALFVNRIWEASNFKHGQEANLDALRSMAGLKVGAERGTALVDRAKEMFPRAEIVTFSGARAVIGGVVAGQVATVLVDDFDVALGFREKPGLALDIRPIILPDWPDKAGVVVAPSSPNLLAFVNVVLDAEKLAKSSRDIVDLMYPPTGRKPSARPAR